MLWEQDSYDLELKQDPVIHVVKIGSSTTKGPIGGIKITISGSTALNFVHFYCLTMVIPGQWATIYAGFRPSFVVF